jgi:SAM-dependent methyltransferase
MDPQHLGFPDAFFGAVVAQYVFATVPDPEAALDEFARVTKAGGEIILVNHLGAEAGPRCVFERSIAPGGWAGGRNSAGSGWRDGPSGTAVCACSNAARCRRSAISR